MKTLVKFITFFLLGSNYFLSFSQDVSFIALGDMHYDRLDLHDWDYVKTRPQDLKQILDEYPEYTAVNMKRFLQLIKKQSNFLSPSVKAVVQLGDLVQGVAGSPFLARKMNRGIVDLLYSIDLKVPWILTKGNHDVSNSPGQPEAWQEVIRPFIENQIGKSIGYGMYTYKIGDNIEFFVLDQFFSDDRNLPETEMVKFLETELEASTAEFKFVLTHQPIIPVTERSWHLLSGIRRPIEDPVIRERFLDMLGKHKVIVLCAHLHKYSVVSRRTSSGNIVQVMINSVNRIEDPVTPTVEKEYKGGKWVEENPEWQPSNNEIRKELLAEEKKHILYFTKTDLPGYAVFSVEDNKKVILNYYAGFSEKPYENINLTELQNLKMP